MIKQASNFLWLWGAILVANQVLIFNACFAKHCVLAALPHTGLLAAFFFFGYRKLMKAEKETGP
jgi:hypothetical protein